MGPGVRGDLVSFSDHTLDQIWVGSCGVNLSLAVVVAGDEERGVEAVLLESVEELCRVVVWTIVV